MTKPQHLKFDETSIAFESKSNSDLKKIHFIFSTMKWPWMVKLGTVMTDRALKMHLPVRGLIKKTLFDLFCGGESIEDSAGTIDLLGKYGVTTILDYSVEGLEQEDSFDEALTEAMKVADFAAENPNITFCVMKFSGIGSHSLLTKVQKGVSLNEEDQMRYAKIKSRVDQLAKACFDRNLRFMIDAEESWIQDVIDEIALELMIKYNQQSAVVYNTYQCYRHRSLDLMKEHFEKVTSKKCFFGAKIVRGAYMEKERRRAEEEGYEDPIQKDKSATDRDFNAALNFAVSNLKTFSLCAGTHNEDSCSYLAGLLEENGIPHDHQHVFFAQLLGMSDNISFKLSKEGFNVAKYVPYGPVQEVLPYLFRRAEENTSIAGQSGRELSLVKHELNRRRQKS